MMPSDRSSLLFNFENFTHMLENGIMSRAAYESFVRLLRRQISSANHLALGTKITSPEWPDAAVVLGGAVQPRKPTGDPVRIPDPAAISPATNFSAEGSQRDQGSVIAFPVPTGSPSDFIA